MTEKTAKFIFAANKNTIMAGRNLFFLLACLHRTFLFLLLPASCSLIEDTPDFSTSAIHINIKSGVASISIRKLDVFIFEADDGGNLDSYRHIDGWEDAVSVASRSGPKRVVVVANADSGLFTVGNTISYDAFSKIRCRIYDEVPEFPVMSAEFYTDPNNGPGHHYVELVPLMSKIRLKSLNVDFSATPYAGKELTDIKAYLINVPGGCILVPDEENPVDEVLNYSGLSGDDVRKMKSPSMIYTEETDGATFCCYPCTRSEDELGRCAPRLVIEGKVGESLWYYPINIGTDKVERGVCYNVYATITRLGMTDPDTAAESSAVKLEFEKKEWETYENETLDY